MASGEPKQDTFAHEVRVPSDAAIVHHILGSPSSSLEPPDLGRADLVKSGLTPDRAAFFDRHYNGKLRKIVTFVIDMEGPIYEDALVARVARAHDFQRAGRHIVSRIKEAVRWRHKRSKDDGRTLLWPSETNPGALVAFRSNMKSNRELEDIPLVELASLAIEPLKDGQSDEAAVRHLQAQVGMARLRESSRERIEAAVALARRQLKAA